MIYKHIMVAVDGSKTAYLAVKEAARLAKNQQSQLRVIYVVDETVLNYVETYVNFDALWDASKETGKSILNKIAIYLQEEKIEYETQLVELKPYEGHLAEKIAAEAEKWPADLLVVGTHGRRGFSHFFIGSVAENIVRRASMPVLLVRGQEAM